VRGLVDDLRSPNPFQDALPSLLQEDDFACRFVGAFDTVLAPVFASLDSFTAYLDPGTAPEDFLEWVAGWFGLELDATWSVERRRASVRDVVELYRWRGTVRGVRAHVLLHLGFESEVIEQGGVAWSPTPGGVIPGEDSGTVTVRIRVPDPDAVHRERVEAVVRSVVPAHLVCVVELVADPDAAGTPPDPDAAANPETSEDAAAFAPSDGPEPERDGATDVGEDGEDGEDGSVDEP
jgi:phage tail-like protein